MVDAGMHRLFVALRPPLAIREALTDLMDGVPDARWQDDDQLHLTLRFVGEVERVTAEDLAAALARIRAPVPHVALAGVGAFEKRGRADSLWARVTPHDALAHLHRKVDQACVAAGIAPDGRAYLPHITLARLARSAGGHPAIGAWIARHDGTSSAPFAMPHLVLYESRLSRSGATYDAVARWPLGTGDPLAGSPA